MQHAPDCQKRCFFRKRRSRKPSPGEKVDRRQARRKRNGDIRKFAECLFLRTKFNIFARIFLPPQCAHWGTITH